MTSAKDIFLDAIDLSPGDRDAFVLERCEGDAALHGEVQQLLAAHVGSEEVFGDAAFVVPGLEAGDRIGPYELVEEIGEGGFAVVWRARQTEPLKRTVALKVLKPGLETRQVVARFDAERHALALMDHPGIAKVIDGGVTDSGRPWFSMELVEGQPITEHCDAAGLDKRERLELFLKVCRAVQHAHQKGVVHRDLKPSNILVTVVDGRSEPKVIDFGIAKAIEQRLGDATILTLEGQVIGTPAYMSPEQVDESLDIDTRADVYALGVLLYEVLCGARPFEDETLRAAGLAEILRIIREVEPPRPSSRRVTTTNVLAKEIRGDLDWIVMRCLEKDRDRRYDSAGVVGNEIERHLGGEPVLAGPPDLAYRARKFAARHRFEIAFAVTVSVLLVVGIIASVTQMIRARAAETRKDVELSKFIEISQFYESILMGVDPAVAQGEDTALVLEILEDSASRVTTELADAPEVEATVRRAIAGAFRSVGEPGRAEVEFRRVIELREATLGLDDRNRYLPKYELGTLLVEQERYEEAESLLLEATREIERTCGPEDENTLRALSSLATLRRVQGELEESEEMHRDLLARWVRGYGEEHDSAIMAVNNLASVVRDRGDLDEAAELFGRAVELELRVHGPTHPDRLIALNNLGDILLRLGRRSEALPHLERALELKEQVLPEAHPSLLVGLNNLASFYQDEGRYDEALAHFARGLDMIESTDTDSTPTAIKLRFNHGVCLDKSGDLQAALGEYERCAELAAERFGPTHALTVQMQGSAAWELVKLGRAEEAEPVLRRTLEHLEESEPDDGAALGVSRIRLGVAWRDLGSDDDARDALRTGLDELHGSGRSGALSAWVLIAETALSGLQNGEGD